MKQMHVRLSSARGKANNLWQWGFDAFLLALLLFGGVAWAQGRNDLQEPGQQQPLQTDLVNQNQQSLDLSIDRHNSQSKDGMAARVTDIKKSAETGSTQAESFASSSRRYGMYNPQRGVPQSGSLRSSLIGKGYDQSSSFGSTSFLDGYLLKSLYDQGIPKKEIRNERKIKDDLRIRGNTSF